MKVNFYVKDETETKHTCTQDPDECVACYEETADQLSRIRDALWKMRWPGYCRACGGWGGHQFSQSHPYGSGSATEILFDLCEEGDENMCHRCGQLKWNVEKPCDHCGHDCDDGLEEAL